MIEKIEYIKNMAVFKDFDWRKTLRDKGNNHVDFKKINIIYGRNYSGKTTLSRIFRSLEVGDLSSKYGSPSFEISFNGANKVTESTLMDHDYDLRVFNEDFVKDNLKFMINEEESVNSFAILGEKNNDLEEKIQVVKKEIGSKDSKDGLHGDWVQVDAELTLSSSNYTQANNRLQNLLREKANNTNSGIKHNKLFGYANYDISNIRKDIMSVLDDSYVPLNHEQVEDYRRLLDEDSKERIQSLESTKFNYNMLASQAKILLEKKIKVSDPLQELLSDSLLSNWVQGGINIHRGKRDRCGFCGGQLPELLWDKLDKHFNKESKNLDSSIDSLLSRIETEEKLVESFFKIDIHKFYSKFINELELLIDKFTKSIEEYKQQLLLLKQQLLSRKNNIFTSLSFEESSFNEKDIIQIIDRYEELRKESNSFSSELSKRQEDGKKALRLNEVYVFSQDIKYKEQYEEIQLLLSLKDSKKTELDEIFISLREKEEQLLSLTSQLRDESKGAEKINEYLNSFFGHHSLSLQARKKITDDKSEYCFEIIRNGKKAYHLSEGECSLIAFCYFMARLEDIYTVDKTPIIWIDDPISSLDSNHIFFIYSLINAKIVLPDKFQQLFISTHNLDFLKYLKKLRGGEEKKISEYFMLNRTGNSSVLTIMPSYMKQYVTEFNFLFHQIYLCASVELITDENYMVFYNFGNNARKFLEIYLYYKYPDGNQNNDNLRLKRFFDNDSVATTFIERVTNESSHLLGVLERGANPVQQVEAKKVALSILTKLKEKDAEQYISLLKSVGENDII